MTDSPPDVAIEENKNDDTSNKPEEFIPPLLDRETPPDPRPDLLHRADRLIDALRHIPPETIVQYRPVSGCQIVATVAVTLVCVAFGYGAAILNRYLDALNRHWNI